MPEWSVPGYTAIRALGSGGFGEVILARHDASGVLVAIKYLRHELLADPGFAGMFRGEAQALASVEDPNVVRLYEYVESPAGAAIVMELVNGVSLHEILAHQGRTAPEAALAVLQGSLLGLAAAHRRGVVHRDYKPENVLVNGHGVSKLTDFGLAARTGDRPAPAGTLMYVAPEQIDGAPASPAGDIYSATATFYECLTGRPPFAGDSAELLCQHHWEPVPLDPVPEPLRALAAAGMAKDPAHRPADTLSFSRQLQAIAFGGYGRDWEGRGRSHLGEAALLLAGLWPASGGPAVREASSQRVSELRHITPAKAAIAAGAVIGVAAAGTALAVSRGPRPHQAAQPAAVVQQVSLVPTSPRAARPKSKPATPAGSTITTPATVAQPTKTATTPAVVRSTRAARSPTPQVTRTTPAPPPPPPAPGPRITSVQTFTQGVFVYFKLDYTDSDGDAEGFGFVGVKGSGWAEEQHPFSSPSYGTAGPGWIEYPFNQNCGQPNASASYVKAWIYDTRGDDSQPAVIHLVCSGT
jgi:eukaryotic-like serine/threonine-protein kinase